MSQQYIKPKQIAPGTDGDMLQTLAGVVTSTPFGEAVDDRVASLLVAGTDITLTYNDAANTLTIDAASSGASAPGSLRYYVDGRLAVLTGVAGRFIAPQLLTITAIYITANTPGSASSTIVDVNRNGTTIFLTQANRPTLAFNASPNWASGVPDLNLMFAGDALTIDIDQVATGAEGLGVTVCLEAVLDDSSITLALPDTQLDTYKYGATTANRVLYVGSAGHWDQDYVLHPCVVEHAGTVYMFYNGVHVGVISGTGVATASTAGFTGLSWTKYASNPVISGGSSGAWDELGAGAAWVMYDADDAVWKMWYTGAAVATPNKWQLGYATASSPFGPWTKYASNPVLSPSVTWEGGSTGVVAICSVLKESPTSYKMLYMGNAITVAGKIGLATSTDGITWTKYASNPVLSPSGAGFMAFSVGSPRTLFKSGSTYYMQFIGKSSTGAGSRCAWASSTDLHTWTLGTHNPTITQTRAWEIASSSSPDDVEDPNYIRLGPNHFIFYDAYSGPGIGLIVLPV